MARKKDDCTRLLINALLTAFADENYEEAKAVAMALAREHDMVDCAEKLIEYDRDGR